MLKEHYPARFDADPALKAKAEDLAGRTWELTAFLTDARGMTDVNSDLSGKITYHDSCSGLREPGVQAPPRRLLQSFPGVELPEITTAAVCFGFCATSREKYPSLSNKLVTSTTEINLA